jgi:hypothetical protein
MAGLMPSEKQLAAISWLGAESEISTAGWPGGAAESYHASGVTAQYRESAIVANRL